MKKNYLHGIRSQGFTLIELLVVTSIVSLMGSIVLASLSSARQKAAVAAGQIFSGGMSRTLADETLLFLNFDNMSALDLTNFSLNQGGILPISAVQLGGGPASLVSDSDLFKRGKQLNIGLSATSTYNLAIVVTNISNYLYTGSKLNFTVSGWYKPSGAVPSNPTVFVGGSTDANAGFYSLGFNFNSSGNVTDVVAGIPSGSTKVTTTFSGVNLTANQWYHIALTVKDNGNSTANVAVFINGKKFNQTAAQTALGYAAPSMTGANYVTIGGTCCQLQSPGNLDDIAIYGIALSARDVHEIYAATSAEHGIALK